MNIYLLDRKFYALFPDMLWEGEHYSSRLRDLTRYSVAVLEGDFNNHLTWDLKKNRPTGERLKFFTIEDALSYLRTVFDVAEIPKHNGFIQLNSDADVIDVLHEYSSLYWAYRDKGRRVLQGGRWFYYSDCEKLPFEVRGSDVQFISPEKEREFLGTV